MVKASHTSLPLTNKAAVLRAIATNGPISRVELSKKTRLSKMSITNIVSALIDEGVVVEAGTTSTEAGRKPILLSAASERPLFAAVQITRHYIGACLVNMQGNILQVNTTPVYPNETQTSIIAKTTNLLDGFITPATKPSMWGIGVTSMGPVDSSNGRLLSIYYIDGLSNINIAQALSEKYGVPVSVENDLNALALAEKYFGNAKEYDTFAVVGSSIGLGCGIVCGGNLHTSKSGNCPEIGHVTVQFDGVPCYCGNMGCLEQYASIPKIIDWTREQAQARGAKPSAQTWADLIEGARQSEPLCVEAIDRLVRILGLGLLTIVNLFDPQCILLAEDYYMAADILCKPLAMFINERKFSRNSGPVRVISSRFAGAAPLIAPAALAIDSALQRMGTLGNERSNL